MTNDTNLHDHPAVRHLLASEFCPTKRGDDGDTYLLTRKPGGWGWSGTSSRVDDDLAHSLLELAAVRAMCLSPNVSALIFGPCYEPERGAFYATAFCEGAFYYATSFCDEGYGEMSANNYFAPTEPEAVLAAYQAMVMQETKSD